MTLGSESDRHASRHYFRGSQLLCCQQDGGPMLEAKPKDAQLQTSNSILNHAWSECQPDRQL